MRRATAAAASSGCSSTPGGSTIAAPAAAASRRSRFRPCGAGTKIARVFRSSARDSPERSVSIRTRSTTARGTNGRPNIDLVRTNTTSQPGRSRSARSTARATGRADGRHSTAITLRFGAGEKRSTSTPSETTAVVAGKALRGGRRGALGRREQRVDAVEQALALRFAGRVGEALRREERRDREGLRVAEGEVREARQTRLDPVDDVVAPFAERELEVEAGADRHAHLRAARDRHRRPDGDQLRVRAALEDLPPGRELAGAVRRGEHRDVVPERPQLPGDPVDVLVDGVRLRPGEGRDEADPEAHRSPQSSPGGLNGTADRATVFERLRSAQHRTWGDFVGGWRRSCEAPDQDGARRGRGCARVFGAGVVR